MRASGIRTGLEQTPDHEHPAQRFEVASGATRAAIGEPLWFVAGAEA